MTDATFLPDGYHALAPGKLANVVTFVEMTEAPDRPRQPAPAGYTLEPIERWDTDAFLDLYREIGWEWLWSSRLLMPREKLEAKLAAPHMRSWCPVKDGRRMGIVEMDLSKPGETEISFFGLVPDAVGGGIGGWMMREAIALAFGRPGVKRLWLHTCHFDSPQALPFYMHMGFVPYARAVEVHDDVRLLGELGESAGSHIPMIRNGRAPDLEQA
ncbi:GNAT family N-acetyltransferase [Pleomorphomonas sp. NRK KF1]|uniref:GNAT family N-acetyltransferase n=1 Tax=Pleomorphomonas sp. NRK KF1 TaxID=2943000 RepID=UPI002043E50C|nr:GNAT family N-acetyltransferase [Pleomorphomonas sp. NRK KF1]MCM5553018.1 GNAT family N-acetyltransferase [Pleomorphomonas sp. NRK KF1]